MTLKRLCFFILFATSLLNVGAAPNAKIYKVLPHLLDLNGKHVLSPSLYERDGYQDYLRNHPEEQSAIRFDIRWRAAKQKAINGELVVAIELRTRKGDPTVPLVLRKKVKAKRFFSQWDSILLSGKQFEEAGEVVAWRVTLKRGDEVLATQQSFLW